MFSVPWNQPVPTTINGVGYHPPIPDLAPGKGSRSAEVGGPENEKNTVPFMTPAPENSQWDRGIFLFTDTRSSFTQTLTGSAKNSVPATLLSLADLNQWLKRHRNSRDELLKHTWGDPMASEDIIRRFQFTGVLYGHNSKGRLLTPNNGGVYNDSDVRLAGDMYDVSVAVAGRINFAMGVHIDDRWAALGLGSERHPAHKKELAKSAVQAHQIRTGDYLHFVLVRMPVSMCGPDDMAGSADDCWQFMPYVSRESRVDPKLLQFTSSKEAKDWWTGRSVFVGTVVHPNQQRAVSGVEEPSKRAAQVFVHGSATKSLYGAATNVQRTGDHPTIHIYLGLV